MDTISNVILYIIAVLLGIIGYFLIRFVKSVDKNNELTAEIILEQAKERIQREHLTKEVEDIKKNQISKDAFDLLKKDVHDIKDMFKNLP